MPTFLEAELQWPLAESLLHGNFSPAHPQVTLSGYASQVIPMIEGELLYVQDSNDFSSMPSPLGGYILLEHSDSFLSFYAGVEIEQTVATRYAGWQPLAVLDGSGYSYEQFLQFGIFDREQNSWINPRILLPDIEDARQLSIDQIYVEKDESYIYIKTDNEIADSPYRIRYSIDSVISFEHQFETDLTPDGFAILSSLPFTLRLPLQRPDLKHEIFFWTYDGKKKHARISEFFPSPLIIN